MSNNGKALENQQPRLLDLKQAAEHTGLSYWYLRDAAEKGLIARVMLPDPFKPGRYLRRILFRRETLDQFIEQSERK